MAARRPIVLVAGTPATMRELVDGDASIVEEFVDRNGSTWLSTVATSGARNYLRVTPVGASGPVVLSAQGSDANVDLQLLPKGTGKVRVVDFADATGLRYLEGTAAAGAINWLRATAAAAGGAVVLSAQGGDTNIDLQLTPKGSGKVRVVSLADATGLRYLEGTAAASAVNYLRATAAAAGGAVVLSAQGSDANISLQLLAKGTGMVVVADLAGTNGLRWLKGTSYTNAVNYIEISSNSTGGGPLIEAKGTDGNIDLLLYPKGAGVVRAGGERVVTEMALQVLQQKDLRDPTNQISWDPSFGCVKQLVKRPAAAAFDLVGCNTAPTLDGTSATDDSTTRPLIKFTTAASANAKSGLITSGLGIRPNWAPEMSIPVRFGPDVDQQYTWIGWGSADLASGTGTAAAVRAATFMWAPEDYGDMQAIVSDGTNETLSGTGVGFSGDEHATFRIKCVPDGHGGADYYFWINNVLVAQINTTIPNMLLEMHAQVRVQSRTGRATSVRSGSMPLWMT